MNKFTLKSTLFLALLGIFINVSAFNNPESRNGGGDQSAQSKEEAVTDKPKTATVTFKKGKVYEFAYVNIKEGMASQLHNEYFPQALPIAAKFGGSMMGGFKVVESRTQTISSDVNMVGIFEWPSLEAREAVLSSKEYKKIVHLRDEAVHSLNSGFFEVGADKQVAFHADKIYEIVGAKMHPTEEAQASLKKYLEVSEPIKRNYGGTYPEFVAQLQPLDAKENADYTPDMQIIVEWASLADNAKLFANEKFATEAAPLMKKAVKEADFVFTEFNFME